MPPSRANIALGVPLGLAVFEVTAFWLRRAHPHPLGLTMAEPTIPRMLGPHGWGPGLTDISFIYGYLHPRDISRPLIEVMTCFSAAHCYLPSLKEALTQAEHRDAVWARDEWADPPGPFSPPDTPEMAVPASGFTHQDRAVVIDGEQRAVPVLSFRHYEALSFDLGTKVVTAVARFGLPDTPTFYTVDDLGPYAAGFRRFMLGMICRPPR